MGGELLDSERKRRSKFHSDERDVKCHACGEYGHSEIDCSKGLQPSSTSKSKIRHDTGSGNSDAAANSIKCSICLGYGHINLNCPNGSKADNQGDNQGERDERDERDEREERRKERIERRERNEKL